MIFFIFSVLPVVLCQWERLTPTGSSAPLQRAEHSQVTHNDYAVIFAGQSLTFKSGCHLNNWNHTRCGDRIRNITYDQYSRPLTCPSDWEICDESNWSSYTSCPHDCYGNGICQYKEMPVNHAYCNCFDGFRGIHCELLEIYNYTHDIWYFDISTHEWSTFHFRNEHLHRHTDYPAWPHRRAHHTAVIDDEMDRMYIYGGFAPYCIDFCNDTWVWDFQYQNWIDHGIATNGTESPHGRWGHAAFWHNDNMYVYGGHRLINADRWDYFEPEGLNGSPEYLSAIHYYSVNEQIAATKPYDYWKLIGRWVKRDSKKYSNRDAIFWYRETMPDNYSEYTSEQYHDEELRHGQFMWLLPMFDITAEDGALKFTSLNPRGRSCTIFVENDTFTSCWAGGGVRWDGPLETIFTFSHGILYEAGAIEDVFVRIEGITAEGWHQKHFAEESNWQNSGSGFPLPRKDHAMALNLDADEPTIILHGGYHANYDDAKLPHFEYPTNESFFLNDLWIIPLNGSVWEQQTFRNLVYTDNIYLTQELKRTSAPVARSGHVIFTIEDLVFIFGGYSGNKFFNDVWRYNLTSKIWIQHLPPLVGVREIPEPRAGHSWSYHAPSHTLYMFGGRGMEENPEKFYRVSYSQTYFNDIWTLNFGKCWNDCSGHGECHFQHCLCHDGYLGSYCQHTACPDTICTYDGATWLHTCIHCSGRGNCTTDGVCMCNQGYESSTCSEFYCPLSTSSAAEEQCGGPDQGVCVENSVLKHDSKAMCSCINNHTGDDCLRVLCPFDYNGRGECSGRGDCVQDRDSALYGHCECHKPHQLGRKYIGPDCGVLVLDTDSTTVSGGVLWVFIMVILVGLLILLGFMAIFYRQKSKDA